jgi:DNA polymerase/3'-5' exonuclease PolX
VSKSKFKRDEAMEVAKDLHLRMKSVTQYTPTEMHWEGTNLLAVVGSLRRGKPEVSDIELLYVPRFETVKTGLFQDFESEVNLADAYLDALVEQGILAKRPNVNGHLCWGPLNKHAVHLASGIPVDLFATAKDHWWVSLVIRTGSKETNLKLTMGAINQNATLNAYGAGITWSNGKVTPATSEAHLFEMCRVPYLPPGKR